MSLERSKFTTGARGVVGNALYGSMSLDAGEGGLLSGPAVVSAAMRHAHSAVARNPMTLLTKVTDPTAARAAAAAAEQLKAKAAIKRFAYSKPSLGCASVDPFARQTSSASTRVAGGLVGSSNSTKPKNIYHKSTNNNSNNSNSNSNNNYNGSSNKRQRLPPTEGLPKKVNAKTAIHQGTKALQMGHDSLISTIDAASDWGVHGSNTSRKAVTRLRRSPRSRGDTGQLKWLLMPQSNFRRSSESSSETNTTGTRMLRPKSSCPNIPRQPQPQQQQQQQQKQPPPPLASKRSPPPLSRRESEATELKPKTSPVNPSTKLLTNCTSKAICSFQDSTSGSGSTTSRSNFSSSESGSAPCSFRGNGKSIKLTSTVIKIVPSATLARAPAGAAPAKSATTQPAAAAAAAAAAVAAASTAPTPPAATLPKPIAIRPSHKRKLKKLQERQELQELQEQKLVQLQQEELHKQELQQQQLHQLQVQQQQLHQLQVHAQQLHQQQQGLEQQSSEGQKRLLPRRHKSTAATVGAAAAAATARAATAAAAAAEAGGGFAPKIVRVDQHKVPKTIEDGIDISYQYFVNTPLARGKKPLPIRYLYRPMVRRLNQPNTSSSSRRRSSRKTTGESKTEAEEEDDKSQQLQSTSSEMGELRPTAESESEMEKEVENEDEKQLFAPPPPIVVDAKYLPFIKQLENHPMPGAHKQRKWDEKQQQMQLQSQMELENELRVMELQAEGHSEQQARHWQMLQQQQQILRQQRLAIEEQQRQLQAQQELEKLRPRPVLIDFQPKVTRLESPIGGASICFHAPIRMCAGQVPAADGDGPPGAAGAADGRRADAGLEKLEQTPSEIAAEEERVNEAVREAELLAAKEAKAAAQATAIATATATALASAESARIAAITYEDVCAAKSGNFGLQDDYTNGGSRDSGISDIESLNKKYIYNDIANNMGLGYVPSETSTVDAPVPRAKRRRSKARGKKKSRM